MPNLIINGDFETSDFTGWTVGHDPGTTLPSISSLQVHGGSHSAFLGDPHGVESNGDMWIQQDILVPADADARYSLSFFYYALSEDNIGSDWQQVTLNADTPLKVCSNAQTWVHSVLPLHAYAGLTVTVKFLVHEDGFGDVTNWFLDDISTGEFDPIIETPVFVPASVIVNGYVGIALTEPSIEVDDGPVEDNHSVSYVSDQPWLTVDGSGGVTPDFFGVAIDTTGLAVGTYTGNITATTVGSAVLPVTLTLTATPRPQFSASHNVNPPVLNAPEDSGGTQILNTIITPDHAHNCVWVASSVFKTFIGTWAEMHPVASTAPLCLRIRPSDNIWYTDNSGNVIESAVSVDGPYSTADTGAGTGTNCFLANRWDIFTPDFLYGFNNNNQVTRSHITFDTGIVDTWSPLPFLPAAGAGYTVNQMMNWCFKNVGIGSFITSTFRGHLVVSATGAAVQAAVVLGQYDDGTQSGNNGGVTVFTGAGTAGAVYVEPGGQVGGAVPWVTNYFDSVSGTTHPLVLCHSGDGNWYITKIDPVAATAGATIQGTQVQVAASGDSAVPACLTVDGDNLVFLLSDGTFTRWSISTMTKVQGPLNSLPGTVNVAKTAVTMWRANQPEGYAGNTSGVGLAPVEFTPGHALLFHSTVVWFTNVLGHDALGFMPTNDLSSFFSQHAVDLTMLNTDPLWDWHTYGLADFGLLEGQFQNDLHIYMTPAVSQPGGPFPQMLHLQTYNDAVTGLSRIDETSVTSILDGFAPPDWFTHKETTFAVLVDGTYVYAITYENGVTPPPLRLHKLASSDLTSVASSSASVQSLNSLNNPIARIWTSGGVQYVGIIAKSLAGTGEGLVVWRTDTMAIVTDTADLSDGTAPAGYNGYRFIVDKNGTPWLGTFEYPDLIQVTQLSPYTATRTVVSGLTLASSSPMLYADYDNTAILMAASGAWTKVNLGSQTIVATQPEPLALNSATGFNPSRQQFGFGPNAQSSDVLALPLQFSSAYQYAPIVQLAEDLTFFDLTYLFSNPPGGTIAPPIDPTANSINVFYDRYAGVNGAIWATERNTSPPTRWERFDFPAPVPPPPVPPDTDTFMSLQKLILVLKADNVPVRGKN